MDWTEEWQLGLPAIDAQHRELFELCRQFQDAAPTADGGLLTVILDRLVERTREHFRSEEGMLDRHGYPGLAAHRAEHGRLLTDVKTLRERWPSTGDDAAQRASAIEVADYLRLWLIEHIQVTDRPYKPFLSNLV